MTIISPNHAAIRSALVWSIALAGLTLATASWAEDARKGTVAEKEVQAKLQYCKVCHGVSAQGFRGYYPIPRLAGQQPPYLENQLQAFIEHRRTNWNIVGTKTRRIIGIMTVMSVNIVKRVSEGRCPWCALACFPAPACKMQAKASEDDI
jgi:cytochrome c553